MSGRDLQDPTLTGSTATNAGAASGPVPCLSILWHRDVSRVGEIAQLGRGRTQVSRLDPLFTRPGSRDTNPLASAHLSRASSVEIRILPGNQVEVAPGDTDLAVEVEGERLASPRSFASADLDAGVPIALGKQVALCLHLATIPAASVPSFGMIGESDKMRTVRATIARLSDLDAAVLIRGETGSGKEMVARALVTQGPRKKGPFVAVNMATVSAATAEAQLFGHERGAFTGADQARPGFFVQADRGTLFLDEAGLAPPGVQAMLLRVLETGEVRPLGGKSVKPVDVRVIAATDAHLEEAIADKTFSEALFHRLAGFQIEIPPLRLRRQDIGPLLLHFLRDELRKTDELDRLDENPDARRPWLPADLVARLAMSDWPGNVRSLANVARQIAISSRGQPHAEIDPVVLNVVTTAAARVKVPARAVRDEDAPDREPSRPPSDISPDALLSVLQQNKYEPGAAAAALGISRNSLYELIERHPGLRKAGDIPADEIARLVREEKGDLDRASQRLQVSKRSLALRMRQLKLDR